MMDRNRMGSLLTRLILSIISRWPRREAPLDTDNEGRKAARVRGRNSNEQSRNCTEQTEDKQEQEDMSCG